MTNQALDAIQIISADRDEWKRRAILSEENALIWQSKYFVAEKEVARYAAEVVTSAQGAREVALRESVRALETLEGEYTSSVQALEFETKYAVTVVTLLRHALSWTGGSFDFSSNGLAEQGWKTIATEAFRTADAYLTRAAARLKDGPWHTHTAPVSPESPAKPSSTPSRVHYLKTWPEPFQAILDGRKAFEIRKDDRAYAVGDGLKLQEYDPSLYHKAMAESTFAKPEVAYTGRSALYVVTYLVPGGAWGLPTGMCVMGIARSGVDNADL